MWTQTTENSDDFNSEKECNLSRYFWYPVTDTVKTVLLVFNAGPPVVSKVNRTQC